MPVRAVDLIDNLDSSHEKKHILYLCEWQWNESTVRRCESELWKMSLKRIFMFYLAYIRCWYYVYTNSVFSYVKHISA